MRLKLAKSKFEKGKFRSEEDILLFNLKKKKDLYRKREAIRKLLR